jgi:hypothetical protein
MPSNKTLFSAVIVIASVLAFASSLLVYLPKMGKRMATRSSGPPNGISVKLQPRTFTVETRQRFSLQATNDFDDLCDHVEAVIPDQQWHQTFTRAELLHGVQADWNPTHTGTFQMQFLCGGRALGEAGVSVVIRPVVNRPKSKNLRWVLTNGKPVYRDDAFFQVPIMVSSEQGSQSSFVPNSVDHDIYLTLRDRNGQLSNLNPLVIQRNTAISEPIYVPLAIGAEYRLIAYEKNEGQPSNELKVSWKELAPNLSLAAFPANVDLYSAGVSSSSVQLYLTLDSRQIRPDDSTDVLFDTPRSFTSEPADAVTLLPNQPRKTYHLSAPTQTGTWNVDFQAPRLGVNTIAAVKVLPTYQFILAAIVTGLVGILIARRGALFEQTVLAIILELIVATAAAFLLYALLLTGWVPFLRFPGFILTYLGAIVIGLIGGYAGLGVLELAKKLFLG